MNLAAALRATTEPFDDEADLEMLRQAESQARRIRAQEAEALSASASTPTETVPTPVEPVQPAAARTVAAAGAPDTAPPATATPGPDISGPSGAPSEGAGAPAEMPAGLQGTSAGKALAGSSVTHESSGSRALSDIMRAGTGIGGVITCGDDVPEVPAAPKMTRDQLLRSLGFPDRPQTWPSFMAWPPQVVLDRFMMPGVKPEQKAEMIARLLALNEAMLKRSKQIHEWMENFNPLDEQDRLSRKMVARAGNDPHFGIKWATLINPSVPDRAVTATVLSWGYSAARTADGGVLRVHDDSISFTGGGTGPIGYTQQSVALAVQEARNRGWKKLNMSGCYEFGVLAIDAAKKAGIEAEISYSGRGMMSWRTYKVKVMPDVPAPQIEDPGGEGPDVGRTPAPARPKARSPKSTDAGPTRPELIADNPGDSPMASARRRNAAEASPDRDEEWDPNSPGV